MSGDGERPSRIPRFETVQEAAQFWDTHDLTDYEDELEPVDVQVAGSPRHSLSISLEGDAFRRLSALARERQVNVIELARSWVLEGIEREGRVAR